MHGTLVGVRRIGNEFGADNHLRSGGIIDERPATRRQQGRGFVARHQ
jgi:hypothetical protein